MNKGLTPNVPIIDEPIALDPIKDDWRPIPGFDGYEINRAGEVYSLKSECFMSTDHGDSKQVKLAGVGNTRYTRSVAKLIDLAFPEYVVQSPTPDADVVAAFIKEEMGVQLSWYQRRYLNKWITDHKTKKVA